MPHENPFYFHHKEGWGYVKKEYVLPVVERIQRRNEKASYEFDKDPLRYDTFLIEAGVWIYENHRPKMRRIIPADIQFVMNFMEKCHPLDRVSIKRLIEIRKDGEPYSLSNEDEGGWLFACEIDSSDDFLRMELPEVDPEDEPDMSL